MYRIRRNTNREIFATLQPLTRRHSVTLIPVSADDEVLCYGTYWDEGTRYTWYRVTLDPERIEPIPNQPTAPPQFGGGDAPVAPVTDDSLIVCGGIFRGKRGYLTVYATNAALEAFDVDTTAVESF